MSFYRKYRPGVISEIDNEDVRHRLLSLLSKDRTNLPHAFLFSGPKGTGKTTSARIIAKLFLCEKPSKNAGPCGACIQCTSIAEGRNMDVIEIDAASNRGIDEIRELKSAISLAPTSGSFKVYIIDEVHMLTTEAFNALLKTLEEPPKHAVFVLATTDPQKVPATIRSRCVELKFRKATPTELTGALKRIATAEKFAIAESDLDRIADVADGAFRDAVKLLEQVSFEKPGEALAREIDRLLPQTDSQSIDTMLAALAGRNAKAAVGIAETAVNEGRDMAVFTADVLRGIHTLLVAAVRDGTAPGAWTVPDLKRASDLFHAAYQQLKYSPHPALPVEAAIIAFCDSGMTAPKPPPAEKPKTPAKQAESAPVPAAPPRKSDVPAGKSGPIAAPPPADYAAGEPAKKAVSHPAAPPSIDQSELLTIDKLKKHWPDVIEALKPFNHSVSGVLRSARPKSVEEGTVTIEAFYSFHKDRLSEPRTRDILADVLKKLFGATVRVDIVLGTK
jgi:DNA polymerase-3 subunit gamma/tau